MDRRHPGGTVATRSRLDGNPGESLTGRGQTGRRPDLQLRLVIRGQQQERGVGVEHVARPFDRALQQAVEVVRGGRADEHLERVRRAVLGRGVGNGGAHRALQHRALVITYEEADRGRLAPGVADPEVRRVHRDDAAVGAADAVAALPAGELQGVGDTGVRAGSVRPGRDVRELLARDLVRRVPEEESRVVVPRGDGTRTVDLDDGHPNPLVGDGEECRGQDRSRGTDAHRAVRKIELEPDVFVRGEYSTPQREASAAQSSRPRPPSRSGLPKSRPELWSGISLSG